jgi:hypothetical protein
MNWRPRSPAETLMMSKSSIVSSAKAGKGLRAPMTDGEEMLGVVGVREEGLEDLFGGEADFFCDGDRSEVFGIDLVGAELIGNAEGVEETGGVCLCGCGGLHPLVPVVSVI